MGVTELFCDVLVADLGLHKNVELGFFCLKKTQTLSFPTGNSYVELKFSSVLFHVSGCNWINLGTV